MQRDEAFLNTNPNIMITARLLLMPVLRSVELKVVLWAKAGTVLSANRAATARSGRQRFRNRIFFFIVLCVFSFLIFVGGTRRRSRVKF
jgi:hypothetical protein